VTKFVSVFIAFWYRKNTATNKYTSATANSTTPFTSTTRDLQYRLNNAVGQGSDNYVELNNQCSVEQQQTDERVQEEQLQIADEKFNGSFDLIHDITYSGLINTLDDSLRRQESRMNTRPAYSKTTR
jgi:hypothetical protein